jgi:hypothetical protein
MVDPIALAKAFETGGLMTVIAFLLWLLRDERKSSDALKIVLTELVKSVTSLLEAQHSVSVAISTILQNQSDIKSSLAKLLELKEVLQQTIDLLGNTSHGKTGGGSK